MEAWRTAKSAIDSLALQESDPEKANQILAEFFLQRDFPTKMWALQVTYGVFAGSWAKKCGADPTQLKPNEPDANGRLASEPEP